LVSVTMKELLEAGVHFGHQTKRWNPKMKEFIFGQRNGIYIIDLQKTMKVFKEALAFVRTVAEKGQDVLLVGTKKQAQDIIKDYAIQSESSYVNQRWLGGLLTNYATIRGSVDKLIELEEMKEDGRWDLLSKKEQSRLEKIFRKLSKNLGGIKTMQGRPGVMVVIDSTKEDIAILEAQKLRVPIIAIVDTNGDPENIDYPIPGNDDAVRAIELFTSKITEAILEGKKNRMEKELLEQQAAEEEAGAAQALLETEGGETIEPAAEPKSEPEVAPVAEPPAAEPVVDEVSEEPKVKEEKPAEEKPEAAPEEEAAAAEVVPAPEPEVAPVTEPPAAEPVVEEVMEEPKVKEEKPAEEKPEAAPEEEAAAAEVVPAPEPEPVEKEEAPVEKAEEPPAEEKKSSPKKKTEKDK